MHAMHIVTLTDLSHAFQSRLNMDADAAEETAERVLDLFGFDSRIIDNLLEPEERQFFYDLQETGLVTTRSEETEIWNGHQWRTHYWLMRTDRIFAAADEQRAAAAPRSPWDASADVYADLPAECWTRV